MGDDKIADVISDELTAKYVLRKKKKPKIVVWTKQLLASCKNKELIEAAKEPTELIGPGKKPREIN